MTDRRLTLVGVPASALGDPARVICPVADLCVSPGGARDRQLLLGAAVRMFRRDQGWIYVQAADGYVGYLRDAALSPAASAPTHRVATLATHAYQEESIKSPDLMHLSFGAELCVTAERAKFWETPQGFVPKKHLRPLDRPFADPVTVAQLHFGVPYLWGGNSTCGIDCSGLVAAALRACDLPCPADSDMQREQLGEALGDGQPPQRGDLVFWPGHVGMMVDSEVMIHANAHHMAVAYEPLQDAILRIMAQDNAAVLARKRLR